ncbi:glycosyltransferase family 4 protein [Entomohabitans teleogrylli]|uniref:glycosyltransferase family 4 protein n=1 Tax=Entomohabitans teleogrylli TaxID=1384589 RepID=UPI00073D423B|nr:glycosyltransferase family 1 protein [Entomohabitans teleogrylli]
MKVIFATEPIKYPLTGIGRYSLELVRRLSVAPEIDDLRLFHGRRFINAIPNVEYQKNNKTTRHRGLSALLRKQSLLIEGYRFLYPRLQQRALRNYADYIYHGPNFYLPHHIPRAVATFHDISIFDCPEYHPADRVRYMEKALVSSLNSASLILTVSDYSRQALIRLFNYPAPRIVTTKLACSEVYIPRDAQACAEFLQRYDLRYNQYALFIGTLEPRKNINGILQAYQRLPQEVRMRYPLILCGYKGWDDEQLYRLIDQGTREGWVKYLGYVADSELPLLYAAARAFIYPSFYEGFGLPVLEAMSCGVPVICSNTTSLPEVVGEAGLMSDPHDIEALTNHILMGLQDAGWREKAIPEGLARAKMFSWENCAMQTINAYKLL